MHYQFLDFVSGARAFPAWPADWNDLQHGCELPIESRRGRSAHPL